MWLLPLGLGAGLISTVAGLGGGQLLVLAIATAWGPREALVVSSPALLLGNLHRLWLYRAQFDRRVALAFSAGALPGSVVGGLLAVGLPRSVLQALLVASTAAAITRALGWWQWQPRPAALAPAGLAIGTVCATSSGAGMLVGPLLLSSGLRGAAYVGTGAACAVAMHLGRVWGYGLGGSFDRHLLGGSLLLGVSMLAGNLLGVRLRRLLDGRTERWIEHGTLLACVTLALATLRR